ncbi:MAG: riboflavin synthase [Melioribacteraceae bacterium]
MFTGLIEEVGTIAAVKKLSKSIAFDISASKILSSVKLGDSIAVNGVCLTVTKFGSKLFSVDAVNETLKKTTLNEFKFGTKVNLEAALALGHKLGGHIVQGHVNGVGKINSIKQLGENFLLSISMPAELEKYIVSEGSIAIDGISLTVAQKRSNDIVCSIIPHTLRNTNLRFKKVGDRVNIEADVLSKYVETIKISSATAGNSITEDWLIKIGY